MNHQTSKHYGHSAISLSDFMEQELNFTRLYRRRGKHREHPKMPDLQGFSAYSRRIKGFTPAIGPFGGRTPPSDSPHPGSASSPPPPQFLSIVSRDQHQGHSSAWAISRRSGILSVAAQRSELWSRSDLEERLSVKFEVKDQELQREPMTYHLAPATSAACFSARDGDPRAV